MRLDYRRHLMLQAAVVLTLSAATFGAEPNLANVLDNPANWKVTPESYVLGAEDGRTSLSAPAGQPLTVQSVTPFDGPVEVVVSYWLRPEKGKQSNVHVQMASAQRSDNTPQALSFSVTAVGGYTSVNYGATIQGGQAPPAKGGVLYFEAVSERSLAWSEEMRKAIEAQIASAPKVEATLLTSRIRAANGRFRCWLNGRLAADQPLPDDFSLAGMVRVQTLPGAALASVKVTPIPQDERAALMAQRFETIPIEGHANAAGLNGQPIDPASLPADQTFAGVPFRLVEPANAFGDHLDVGQSWTRFGALPGYHAGSFGAFGGRWISADRIDPARLCFYIPTGRYKALHLIAIADSDFDDAVPVVSAQFYRPRAGHPFNFSTTVPDRKGKGGQGKPIDVTLANGKKARLYHVTIPLDPDAFSWFTDLDRIGMEITKEVKYFRGYPDPLEYSYHGGGLPSSVQVYAMTLERVGVDVDVQPEVFGHVWTSPAKPSYTVELRNYTGAPTTATLTITTASHDGLDTTEQKQEVALPADDAPVKVALTLSPTRFGLHELTISCDAAGESATYRRNFAHLHPDTRDKEQWQHGRGAVFGYWGWNGGHDTPKADKEITVMAAAGAETSTANYELSPPEIKALAEKHNFISEAAFFGGVMYYNGFYSWYQGAPKFDPNDPEGSGKALIEAMLKGGKAQPSKISRPTFVPFFAEPHFGNITVGIWPSHYGEDYTLTESEQKAFEDLRDKFIVGARAIRKEWPDLKLLVPYGDPMVAAVLLRLAPETRDLIDGCALDLPGFERMPEQQINQVVLNRMYPILKDIKQYIEDPFFTLIEGTCISSKDIDTGYAEQADITTRNFLLLMGYGVRLFESGNGPFDCANYWGENHYGGGWLHRLPVAMPKESYVHYATLTRNLNRANFTKYVPTGSTSAFCQQFQHYKTGKLVHVFWTVRGKRDVTLAVPSGTTLELYDPHDNVTVLQEKDGKVTFTIDQSPQYLHGLTADAQITLGESDHSDSQPGKHSKKIANLGDGSWKLVKEHDEEYETNKPLQIVRFLGDMSAKAVDAPKAQGKKALAVHLGQQDKDRGVMPFYTVLRPKKPIEIPGKASHLGLWVHAASDWGRVVYVVRDAKGEKWLSVGTKDDWNNDDIHAWSAFCFDGWRYLTFQLPASAPYDSYREHGTSWWGSYGGDGIVDLPLSLEKIMVERRPKVIYGADLVDARPDDVLLGDLYAEYASEADMGKEAVRLSRLRMPEPTSLPELTNPIADLAAAGVGEPTRVLRVADPDHQYDGTRCHVHFEPVPGAKAYDVWVSPYPDGRGALQLGKAWTEPGQLITGLRPDTDFYAFVTYTDAEGKVSKPSEPLKFSLKNRFGYK